jgi:hypothetical protein
VCSGSFQCLFCDKYFKTKTVLKEHMRKKQHKRINPKDTDFDRFYIINYLEVGKNWRQLQVNSHHISYIFDQFEMCFCLLVIERFVDLFLFFS